VFEINFIVKIIIKSFNFKSMNKQVETTVFIELFSTFFEKITLNHPEKENLMKHLSKFKSFLYTNQDSLDKGYAYLVTLKQ